MGQKTFVEEIRTLVLGFYAAVGENLVAWAPPAPQIKETARKEKDRSTESMHSTQQDNDKGFLRGLVGRLPLR